MANYCDLCYIDCSSSAQLAQHIKGKSHQKFKKLMDSVGEKSESTSKSEEVTRINAEVNVRNIKQVNAKGEVELEKEVLGRASVPGDRREKEEARLRCTLPGDRREEEGQGKGTREDEVSRIQLSGEEARED